MLRHDLVAQEVARQAGRLFLAALLRLDVLDKELLVSAVAELRRRRMAA